MAQPYLRGKRWYLKYKDARGRWQDKVCSARTKGQAHELLREVQVAEDRARHGLDARPAEDGGGTVDDLIRWWAEKFLKRKVSYGPCIGTIRKHLVGSGLGARLPHRRHGGRRRGVPRRKVTRAGSRDTEPLTRLSRTRVHDGAAGEAVRGAKPGR